jgi:predicted dinucleotide-binding enzyme
VQEAHALLLAVHWSRVDDVLSQAGDLSNKVTLQVDGAWRLLSVRYRTQQVIPLKTEESHRVPAERWAV